MKAFGAMRRATSAHSSDAMALRANSSDGRFMPIFLLKLLAFSADMLTLSFIAHPRMNILESSSFNQTVAVDLKIVPTSAAVHCGGAWSERGGTSGDLYVTVEIDEHPFFRRSGRDLLLTLPVAVHEAALGARVDVPTLDGPVRLRIPPGTPSGQRFRLAGRGVPARAHRTSGPGAAKRTRRRCPRRPTTPRPAVWPGSAVCPAAGRPGRCRVRHRLRPAGG